MPTEGAPVVFPCVGIVGLGLIGGSLALAARQAWPATKVIGVDQADVVASAMRRRAVDAGGGDPRLLVEADVVILAAPVLQNLQVLQQLAMHLPPTTIVTDTGSTKRHMVDGAQKVPSRFTFIGGHPIAGAAMGGLDHATADLFVDRPWLFTPASDAPAAAVGRLTTFVTGLGARPSIIDADAHDRLMAFISHLPQLTSSALMDVVGAAVGDQGLALAGRGLIDTTRLASSPAEIWKDIVATNPDQVGAALDTLIARLQELRQDLGRGRRLTEVFEAAQHWRQALPR